MTTDFSFHRWYFFLLLGPEAVILITRCNLLAGKSFSCESRWDVSLARDKSTKYGEHRFDNERNEEDVGGVNCNLFEVKLFPADWKYLSSHCEIRRTWLSGSCRKNFVPFEFFFRHKWHFWHGCRLAQFIWWKIGNINVEGRLTLTKILFSVCQLIVFRTVWGKFTGKVNSVTNGRYVQFFEIFGCHINYFFTVENHFKPYFPVLFQMHAQYILKYLQSSVFGGGTVFVFLTERINPKFTHLLTIVK